MAEPSPKEITLSPGWLIRDATKAQARLEQWRLARRRIRGDDT